MMMDMLSLGRLALCAVDIYMIYRFLKTMFQFRTSKKLRCLLFLTAAFSMYLVNAFGKSGLNLLIIPALFLVFSLCTYEISVGQGIVYTIIYYAIFGGGREISYELLFRMLSNYLPFEIPQWFASGGIIFLLPEYLLSFLFLLLIERSTKKLEVRKNKELAWYLLIMPVSSFVVLCSFLYMDFPDSPLLQKLMCLGSFLLYFSNAAVFIILAKYTIIMNKVKFEELYLMKQSMEDEKFQSTARINERNRNYIHDIHKYFNTLRILAMNEENQKIVEFIDELEGKLKEEGSKPTYSNNRVLNSIMTEYIRRAQQEGIILTVFVDDYIKMDYILDSDMISIFGNLLDNALEAAGQCERGNKKVDMKLYMGNSHMLVFNVENSFIVTAPMEGTQRLTTKKDSQRHGLGIGIVEKLAEKYGGNLILEESDHIFKATLIISTQKRG